MPRRGAARTWMLVAASLAALALLVVFLDWRRAAPADALTRATYVGAQACASCHAAEHALWTGSHHDLAMQPANDQTVLGDFSGVDFVRNGATTRFFRDGGRFMVRAEGPDGAPHDYEVKHTFGVYPLQQYMVDFPGGRKQVLRVAWDVPEKRWYEVTPPDVPDERLLPSDPLHWTGVAQNWNTMCAECHSTNLQKGYDPKTNTYHTTWSEIDVSCEECHGPASLHVELANRTSLFWDRRHGYGLARLKSLDPTPQIEACAKCHSRRTPVHDGFRPGAPLLDHFEVSLLDESLYHADGQQQDEVYEHGSFLQSKMHSKGIRCSDCHDPHSLRPKFEGNALCAQCHAPGKYDATTHHHHPPGTPGAQCVECHMPATAYMGIDFRRDHSLRVPRPDLSVSLGVPNACNTCHDKIDETPQWAADRVAEWFGPRRWDDPHWAPALDAGRRGAEGGSQALSELARRQTAPAIVRATAVSLLPQYGAEGLRPVEAALVDADPLVRLAAARAVSAASPEGLVERLAPLLSDPSRSVRSAAARRLAAAPAGLLSRAQRRARAAALDEYSARQTMQLDRAAGRLNLASLARDLGKTDEAIAEVRGAIRMEPYLSGPRGELAEMLAETGGDEDEVRRLRSEEADLLERDARLTPESAPTYYRLGLLRFQLQQLAEAEAALAEACRLAPANHLFQMTLALLQERRYHLSGDPAHLRRAVASLERLRDMDRSDPRAADILRRLLLGRAKPPADGGPPPAE